MTKKHDIIWLESVDSTNNEARRRISDIDNLSVLAAVSQTAGRGQRGNRWSSKPGENLTFSIVLKFMATASPIRACDQFAISEIAALAVVDFLSGYGIEAKIKWPNDIYVENKKICGILIENAVREGRLTTSIIGIGLNINQINFDSRLPNPTSMAVCLQGRDAYSRPFELRHSLEEFMDIFASYHTEYLSERNRLPILQKQYISHLWRLGIPVRFIDYTSLPTGHHGGPMNVSTGDSPNTYAERTETESSIMVSEGIIRGLSPAGNLLVEDLCSRTVREFGFKEIGYII